MRAKEKGRQTAAAFKATNDDGSVASVAHVLEAQAFEDAGTRPVASDLDVVAGTKRLETAIANERRHEAAGNVIAHDHRVAAIVDRLDDATEQAGAVRAAAVVAIVVVVIRVEVAERIVVAADADREAYAKAREEADARFRNPDRVAAAVDPDAVA